MVARRGVARWGVLAVASVLCFLGCTSADTESTPTTDPVLTTTIPESGAVLLPEGPYVDGQEVSLLAASSDRIDLYNSFPRLCARVDGGSETCDPSWIQPEPLGNSPAGTQGVAFELPRTHFGPGGESDCGEPQVQCRLLWRTETGRLLSSNVLSFTGVFDPPPVSLEASIDDQVGVVTVRAVGLDDEVSVDDILSPFQMQAFEDDVRSMTQYDPSRLELTWHVGGLCGVGSGDTPLGVDDLESSPSWWAPATLDSTVDPSVARSFFGTSCDQLDPDRPSELSGGDQLDLVVSRDIYGFGGWIDCAFAACWVSLSASVTYPMPDGSTLASGVGIDRVLVEIPETWPTTRPTITVVEPGPFVPGQEVTVEVHDHPVTRDGLGIAWCPGGEGHCSYKFSSFSNGVHRVTWQLPPDSSDCGSNRCFFEIDGASEGLAPPAIVVVPILAD